MINIFLTSFVDLQAHRPDLTDTRHLPHRLHPHNQHHRASTLDRIPTVDRPVSQPHRGHYTVDRNRGRPYNNSNPSSSSSNLTAAEVANLLRSSIRRNTRRSHHQNNELVRGGGGGPEAQNAASAENLVEAAAPIGQDSSVPKSDEQPTLVQKDQRVKSDEEDIKKTAGDVESSVSVI